MASAIYLHRDRTGFNQPLAGLVDLDRERAKLAVAFAQSRLPREVERIVRCIDCRWSGPSIGLSAHRRATHG